MSDSAGKRTKKLFIIALGLILVGSIFAHMFNTSFYSNDVERIKFDTDTGVLSGLLYKPEGASSDDPRPTIITTHGYLNSGEMQDAGAIELSRRGYVVLALDMYDHGHSVNKTDYDASGAFFSFWPNSIYDAVQHMYEKDFVLKDDNGNGIIAVAGHSMGGFSSTMAMVKDEQDFAKTGIRKIHAGLTMGSDYLWSSYLKVDAKTTAKALGPRTVGKVAAHYDEFFFDSAAAKSGDTVIYKNYVNTKPGQTFLGNPDNPESGKFYNASNGGKRIIYTPRELHPWNHFSATTTGHQIDFYRTAFKGYTSPNQDLVNLTSNSQTWFYKELSSFVALIGFFMLMIPLISFILKLPFFSEAKTEKIPGLEGPKSFKDKLVYWVVLIVSALFPAYFFPTLMNKAGPGMTVLKYFAGIVMALSIIFLIMRFVNRDDKSLKSVITGPVLLLAASLVLFLILSNPGAVFKLGGFFNQPTTNQILYWAIVVTGVITIISIFMYYYDKKTKGVAVEQYGFVVEGKSILAGLFTALVAVLGGYIVLYIIDAVFTTDFRFWTWAVKTFEASHVVSALKYAPFFFLYFYVTGITVNSNTDHMEGWKGYLTGIFAIVGGLVIYMLLHYGKLFIDGTAMWPAQALTSILLFALIPTLIVATIYNKVLYKKTGNVYTGVFLNTFLMTMITVANTTLYHGLG